MRLPQARNTDLIEQETDKELLIYDLRNNRAYNLNETSKNVFQACDGKTFLADFKRRYQYTDDLINLALDELQRNDLIQKDYVSPLAGIARREVIKRIGLATMFALPIITSIVAPTSAHAQSSGGVCNRTCSQTTPCTSPCPRCVGSGICTNLNISCTEIGTTCIQQDFGTCTQTLSCSVGGTDICQQQGQPCFNSISFQFGQCVANPATCSVGGASCPNPGGPCSRTTTGVCQGTGTCRAAA